MRGVSPLRSLMVMRPFNWFSTNFQLWIHTHWRFLIINNGHRLFVTSFDLRICEKLIVIDYLCALHVTQCRPHVNCVLCSVDARLCWSCSSFYKVFASEGDSYAGCSQTTRSSTVIMDRKLRMYAVRRLVLVYLVRWDGFSSLTISLDVR